MIRSTIHLDDCKISFRVYQELRGENPFLANIALGRFLKKIDPMLKRIFFILGRSFRSNEDELKNEFVCYLIGVLKKIGTETQHGYLSHYLRNYLEIFFRKKRSLGDELSISPILKYFWEDEIITDELIKKCMYEEWLFMGTTVDQIIEEMLLERQVSNNSQRRDLSL